MADPPLSPEEARALRIEQLERRTSRRVTGVQLPLALVCLAAALYFLVRQAPAVAYYFSSPEPVTLGSEGSYRFDRLRSNTYVQVHGVPLRTAFYGVERGQKIVVVPLQDSPLVVRRPLLPSEEWMPGKPPPPPDPRPFGVRGRLLRDDDVGAYQEAFPQMRKLAGLKPIDGRLWVVIEGEHPGEDRGALIVGLLLLAFAGLNVVLALQGARALLQRRQAAETESIGGCLAAGLVQRRQRAPGQVRQPLRVHPGRPQPQRGGEEEPRRRRQQRHPELSRRPLPHPGAPRGQPRPRCTAWNPESQHRRPDVDALAQLELARRGHPLVVDEGAVLAAQVLEDQSISAPGETGVAAADRGMREPEIAAARPSEDHRPLADGEELTGARPMLGIEEELLGAGL